MMIMKQLDRIIRGYAALLDGNFPLYIFFHFCLYLLQKTIVHSKCASCLYEKTLSYGKIHDHLFHPFCPGHCIEGL